MRNIGSKKIVNNLSYEYQLLATGDESASKILASRGMYGHAIYLLIQSMEKNIRSKIFERVNPNLKYFRDKNKNHSLDASIEFLIDTITTDNIIKEQIKDMFNERVFNGLKSRSLHNNLRYPYYSEHNNVYLRFEYTKNDFNYILEMSENLKKFLNDIHKIY